MRHRSVVLLGLFSLAACGQSHSAGSAFVPQLGGGARQRHIASVSAYAQTVAADSPAAYYRLDDTGTNLSDSSANALNGTYSAGMTQNVAGLIAGDADTAARFPANAFATVPQSETAAVLQPAGAVSIEAWVQWSAAPVFGVIASYGNAAVAPYDNYKLDFDPNFGGIAFQVAVNGAYSKIGAIPHPVAGTVYHVVGTFNSATHVQTLYVNGNALATRSVTGSLTNYTASGFTIGNDSTRVHVGIAAYSPQTNMVYVTDSEDPPSGPAMHGISALSVGANCLLSTAWRQSAQQPTGYLPAGEPTVADGVVYYGTGAGKTVYAFNAASGSPLWNSGALGGNVYAGPLVDRRVYVSAWGTNNASGYLYAFALPETAATSVRRSNL